MVPLLMEEEGLQKGEVCQYVGLKISWAFKPFFLKEYTWNSVCEKAFLSYIYFVMSKMIILDDLSQS